MLLEKERTAESLAASRPGLGRELKPGVWRHPWSALLSTWLSVASVSFAL